MFSVKDIFIYETVDGKKPFREWISLLKDKKAITRIWSRIDRLLLGNFGDCKNVGEGIFELRFHFGPGYRVYFALANGAIIILLFGGDKSTQQSDIRRAYQYWKDYLRRNR